MLSPNGLKSLIIARITQSIFFKVVYNLNTVTQAVQGIKFKGTEVESDVLYSKLRLEQFQL